jgi:hypothetical protein
MLVKKYCSKICQNFFGQKILVTKLVNKFWSHNFGHKILITKFWSQIFLKFLTQNLLRPRINTLKNGKKENTTNKLQNKMLQRCMIFGAEKL